MGFKFNVFTGNLDVAGTNASGPSQVSEVVASLQAAETISAAKVVCAGLYLADKDTIGREVAIGMAKNVILAGNSGDIVTDGIFEDASFSFLVGDDIYLGNLGSVTSTPPTTGFWVKVGTAIKTNAIKLQFQMEPIQI